MGKKTEKKDVMLQDVKSGKKLAETMLKHEEKDLPAPKQGKKVVKPAEKIVKGRLHDIVTRSDVEEDPVDEVENGETEDTDRGVLSTVVLALAFTKEKGETDKQKINKKKRVHAGSEKKKGTVEFVKEIEESGKIKKAEGAEKEKNTERTEADDVVNETAQNRENEIGNEAAKIQKSETQRNIPVGGTGSSFNSGAVSREEIIRKCGVRESSSFTSGAGREKAEGILAEDPDSMDEEPAVCSVEERNARREGKSQRNKDGKSKGDGKQEKNGKQVDGQKSGNSERMKAKLVRNHMMKVLIHEEGKRDENSHWKLLKSLVQYDVGRVFKKIGKLLLAVFGKLLLGLLGIVLIIAAVLAPLIILIYLLFSPVTYFSSLFDQDQTVTQDPSYIKNVLEEMYTDFNNGISDFKSYDHNNQVVYEYEEYSDIDEVTAVYLARICKRSDYLELAGNDIIGYPPYLFIDTKEEKKLLKEVFRQFNDMETEEITVTLRDAEGEEYEQEAEKMTVYCLKLGKWKEMYASSLNTEETELLEKLLEQLDGGIIGMVTGKDEVALDEISVPEGMDEKLLYLAGFIKAEAGNQSEKGMTAVAYVILNRAGGSDGNIKGVLTAPYQFSCYIPYHTVEKYLKEYTEMTEEQRSRDKCWKVAQEAYTGQSSNPIGDRKYYCNPKYCSGGEEKQWEKIRAKNSEEDIVTIGDHVFCRYCW
ncbi:MAG: cell wall hydrolase [Roseburia sp.]